MLPYLFHIYGPIYANCYGITIAIGVIIFANLLDRNPLRTKIITKDQLQTVVLWSILAGIIGGRFLWVISNWPMSFYEIIEIWEGGFAVLGSILAILGFLPFYLSKHKIPVLPLLDLASIYAPLLQSIARIGCFLAGCCYGTPTNHAWGIIYTHPDVAVPYELKNIPIHPAQIYSSIALFIIFVLMQNFFSKYFKKPGQLLAIYLMLSSTERFFVDFWRADQEFFDATYLKFLSFHQWISLAICFFASILFIKQTQKARL